MKKAKRKNSAHVLLFMDASHFVLGCDFLGGIYSKTRRFVRTFSGRQRYNVLGAINFVYGLSEVRQERSRAVSACKSHC